MVNSICIFFLWVGLPSMHSKMELFKKYGAFENSQAFTDSDLLSVLTYHFAQSAESLVPFSQVGNWTRKMLKKSQI